MAFMYGENFIRELLSKQDVIVTDDNRQQVEWVVRGKYPIAIGFSRTLLIPFEKQGLGKNVVGLEDKIIRTYHRIRDYMFIGRRTSSECGKSVY